MRTVKAILILLITLAMTPALALADWMLDPQSSALHFVSIKKGKVGEVHTFRKLDGSIAGDGTATVNIELSSVATNVDIRDERMRRLLFKVGEHPLATVSARVDMASLDLAPGARRTLDMTFTVTLAGKTNRLEGAVTVIGLRDGGLAVVSRTPLIVNAEDFSLGSGVEALRKVVDLPSIAHAVPVTFELVFRRK